MDVCRTVNTVSQAAATRGRDADAEPGLTLICLGFQVGWRVRLGLPDPPRRYGSRFRG
jgi:hypothetical protein